MLRTTTVCLIILALQIFALPEYIENLERDLSSLPEEYQYLAKRAANNDKDANAYCCKNWQHFNNDAVHTKIQSALVPQEHTVTIGYQDCNGNINPTRPPIPLPNPNQGKPTSITSLLGGKPTNGDSSTSCIWTPINKTEIIMTTQFIQVTYLVPNSETFCAPEDYHCCSSYVMLNNNCVHESAVASLEFLMQLGLIGGVGKK